MHVELGDISTNITVKNWYAEYCFCTSKPKSKLLARYNVYEGKKTLVIRVYGLVVFEANL